MNATQLLACLAIAGLAGLLGASVWAAHLVRRLRQTDDYDSY